MHNINVLVIDDDPNDSGMLAEVLRQNGYTVTGIAKSFNEALKLFYGNPPDIVVIDIFLDGKPDGIAFAETINIVPNAAKPFVS